MSWAYIGLMQPLALLEAKPYQADYLMHNMQRFETISRLLKKSLVLQVLL